MRMIEYRRTYDSAILKLFSLTTKNADRRSLLPSLARFDCVPRDAQSAFFVVAGVGWGFAPPYAEHPAHARPLWAGDS
jgi:hypothetical protein